MNKCQMRKGLSEFAPPDISEADALAFADSILAYLGSTGEQSGRKRMAGAVMRSVSLLYTATMGAILLLVPLEGLESTWLVGVVLLIAAVFQGILLYAGDK